MEGAKNRFSESKGTRKLKAGGWDQEPRCINECF